MKKYGKEISSLVAWNQEARDYSEALTNDYHHHRLSVINALVPQQLIVKGTSIFDFGCGDAIHLEQFAKKGCDIRGMDISQEMIDLAKKRLSKVKLDSDLVSVGSASELSHVADNTFDVILSCNVLAYLTKYEEDVFYKEAYRLLRPGGHLIVTHSNELFDMYSLNQYTIEFFSRQFVTDDSLKSQLLNLITKHAESESIVTYNVRENPLAYRFKLRKYGFTETKQEFINLHVAPPSLLSKDRCDPDTLSGNEEEKWKLMFLCSTFGSLSIREPAENLTHL